MDWRSFHGVLHDIEALCHEAGITRQGSTLPLTPVLAANEQDSQRILATKEFPDAHSIQTDLDAHFLRFHPAHAGVRRKNTQGSKKAYFVCASHTHSKTTSSDPCRLHLPFRQHTRKHNGSATGETYWKLARHYTKKTVTSGEGTSHEDGVEQTRDNTPQWQHSQTCHQLLPKLTCAQLAMHPVAHDVLGVDPNITAANLFSHVQVSPSPCMMLYYSYHHCCVIVTVFCLAVQRFQSCSGPDVGQKHIQSSMSRQASCIRH